MSLFYTFNSSPYQWHHPWHWLTYGENASGVQAMCAALGIIGLIVYTMETRNIRRTSIAQNEATRRPFIVIRAEVLSGEWEDICKLTNIAVGPALYIKWNYLDDPLPKQVDLGACAQGSTMILLEKPMSPPVTEYMIRRKGLRLEYTDTAKKRYWTEIRLSEDGSMLLDSGDFEGAFSGSYLNQVIMEGRPWRSNEDSEPE